ncbi:Clp protease N-terminal domain-containing protein [Streptomyces stelliscabiei]|uniref:ATP-dependent Clp protease ATP-binding subunit ClpA n=1 Tax=Streptomyces stelliscabiei TaxID=146820 RepID=A0A8I0P9U0_9ACTN|nr:Clp protease N-terminal domain-containing protein [Streptomyces stelliscabiei]KND27467.1 peptidase [Streptomyces stelliscabiei]MBE1600207.1 ATP-dependent Clp protease ATP-binding subunit ClpA [Streptomyces stelliscabiei]MDX2515632.1 Clp protease N-terminal domain-containing protein [Streptomyces stelliscabiei]
MFERFTKDARAVVLGAVDHAERTRATEVTEEHLLLSLLDREASRASFALAALGLAGADRRETVERALAEARRRGGLSRADVDALSGLGIDLSEIVSRVEEAHGVGALASERKGFGSGWARRSGHRPFTRDAKDVLTRSLRAAHAHRDRPIGDEHLLLALTTRPGIPAEVLADHGVTYAALERVLYGAGEAKAG